MTDRYIDPNSGAAPQPGGFSMAPVADAENPEQSADNVTTPEQANEPPAQPEGTQQQDQGVQELPEELQRSAAYDTEIQNQAAPQGPQPGAEDREPVGPVGSYAGDPGMSTTEGGEPVNGDGEPTGAGAEGTSENEGTVEGVAAREGEDDESKQEPDDEKPGGNASRGAWVDYAKSDAGGSKSDEELEGKSRDEIRAMYA